MVLYNEIFVGL